MACCPASAAPYLASDHVDAGSKDQADGVPYYHVGEGPIGLMLLSDIFGWNSGRIRAFADAFAQKGFNVWIPAVMDPLEGGTDGDALPPNFDFGSRIMEVVALSNKGGAWNPEGVTVDKAEKVVKAMLASGVVKFGIIGFCYGGWLGMYLAGRLPASQLVCAAGAHPSIFIGEKNNGGDPLELTAKSNCPWVLYPCGAADAGGMAEGPEYDAGGSLYEALEKKFPGKNRTHRMEKMNHGFMTRGSITGEEGESTKAAITEVVQDMEAFFASHSLRPQQTVKSRHGLSWLNCCGTR